MVLYLLMSFILCILRNAIYNANSSVVNNWSNIDLHTSAVSILSKSENNNLSIFVRMITGLELAKAQLLYYRSCIYKGYKGNITAELSCN